MAKPNNIIEYFAGGNLRSRPSTSISSQPSKSVITAVNITDMAEGKKDDQQPSDVTVASNAKNKKVHFEESDTQKDSKKTREVKSKGEKKAQNSNQKEHKQICCNGRCGDGKLKSGANGGRRPPDFDKCDNISARPDDNTPNRQADDGRNYQAAKGGDQNEQNLKTNHQDQNKLNTPSANFEWQRAQHRQRSKSRNWFRYQVSEYLRRNMSRLMQPSRSEVVIREDVLENETDPAPNAFFDARTGILRVYHGPIYGNMFGSLSLLPGPNDPAITPNIGGGIQDWFPPTPRRGSPFGPTGGSPSEWASQIGDIHGPAFGTRNPLAATNGNRPSTPTFEDLSGSWGDKDSPGGNLGPPPPRHPPTNGPSASSTTDWSGAQPAHTLSWGRVADINNFAVSNNNANSNVNLANPWGPPTANAASQQNNNGNTNRRGSVGNSSNFMNTSNNPNGNTNGMDGNSGSTGNQFNDRTTNGWVAPPTNNASGNNQAQNNSNSTNASPWTANPNSRNDLSAPWGVGSPDDSQMDNNTLLAGSWNGSGIGPPPPANTNGANGNQTWGNQNAAQSTRGWTEADHNEGFAPGGW